MRFFFIWRNKTDFLTHRFWFQKNKNKIIDWRDTKIREKLHKMIK